jgi:hypothetical protein
VILYRSPSGFHERSPRQRCWPRDWDGRWVCNYCRTGFSQNHGDWIRGNHPPKAPHFRTGSCRHGPEGNMSGPTFQVSEWSYNLARWPDVWCSNLIPLQTLNIPQYSSVWGPTSVMPPISMTGDEDPKASGRCTFLQQPHGGRLVCAIVARPYSRPQTSWFFGVKDDPETPWWWQVSIDIDGKSSQYLDVHHQNQAVCLLNIGVTRFDSPSSSCRRCPGDGQGLAMAGSCDFADRNSEMAHQCPDIATVDWMLLKGLLPPTSSGQSHAKSWSSWSKTHHAMLHYASIVGSKDRSTSQQNAESSWI